MLVTDGGFRPDGTFVHLPLHDVATLTEVFRRAVLKMFVKRELMDSDTAQGMLHWPHSGFHAHDGVWVAAHDKEFTARLARYCARSPIALGRVAYDEQARAVTYHSDKPTGPTAGSETTDALEFLARVTSHIPTKGQVLQRYYGWYSSRQRGMRRRAHGDAAIQPVTLVEPEPEAVREARRRWAELLRRIFEVDPLACPRCGAEMRIVAFMTDPPTIDRILDHRNLEAEHAMLERASGRVVVIGFGDRPACEAALIPFSTSTSGRFRSPRPFQARPDLPQTWPRPLDSWPWVRHPRPGPRRSRPWARHSRPGPTPSSSGDVAARPRMRRTRPR